MRYCLRAYAPHHPALDNTRPPRHKTPTIYQPATDKLQIINALPIELHTDSTMYNMVEGGGVTVHLQHTGEWERVATTLPAHL